MKQVLKRWLPRVIVLAIVAGGAAFLWIKKPWAKKPAPLTFSTVQVSKGTIAAQVTANGTLSARGTVEVGAQVSGRVVELHADFNDKVKKGQIIAKLDESVLKAQIDQAQAAYDLAVANLKKSQVTANDAQRQLARQKSLQEQQLVAGATVEQYEVALETAQAQIVASKASISQASANLKQAKTNLGYATIYSPVDGVVLSRAVELGQTVASSLQAPTLFTIAEDLAFMQIDTSVAEGDVGRLKEGMRATFTVDAFPGKNFEGTVRQVRNSAAPGVTATSGVVTYDAVIDVENKDLALRPGMTANVTFVLDKVEDAIKIPNAALRFKPSRDQMMALFEKFGGGRRGSGAGRRGRGGGELGSGAPMGGPAGGGPAGGGPPGGGMGGMGAWGGRGGAGGANGDRKQLWKLVDGKPRMVFVKIGLTDGSTTQLVEGDVQPGDQLITEIQGLPVTTRKMGAF